MARSFHRLVCDLTGLALACTLLRAVDGPCSAAAPTAATRENQSPSPTSPSPAAVLTRRTLVVLGDSLAAGHGVEPDQAFPALLQAQVTQAGLPFEVINAGVSGDTTAGGVRRLSWLLRRPIDVLLIELGGNDGLRGLPLTATHSNLVTIIELTRQKYPQAKILLAGMQMPPNMGEDYTREFRELYPRIAKAKDVTLIPHLLEGVGGRPELNLPDQIHPTPEGHRYITTNVWKIVREVLKAPLP